MIRGIIGVVLGYIAMGFLVFSLFSVSYLLIGPDLAFQPERFEVTPLWLGIWAVVSLFAAIVGGIICTKIARSTTPAYVLAVIVFVLGGLSAIPAFLPYSGPAERTGPVSNLDAMNNARQPIWVAIATPFLGVAGVVLGSRLAGPSGRPTSA